MNANTQRVSEGTDSARRLLHIVDTSQLGERDGVSVGDCCNHECNEGRDCPERIDFAGEDPYSPLSLVLSVVIVTALCLLVWYISPELRALVSIIKN